MKIVIDHEDGGRHLGSEWILRIHAQHQVGSEIRTPWPCVVEIIFGVQRVVSDKTAENATLNGQALPYRGEIRNVGGAQMPQPLGVVEIRCSCGKPEDLRIASRL